ncbi:MAG: sporulation inhibitor of replication protein SirA [Bacillaceae bacterium]
MRKYDIYLIDEEIVEDYIGHEHNLFKTFFEYKTASSLEKYMIEKHLRVLTNKIPTLFMDKQIEQRLSFLPNYIYEKGKHYLNYNHGYSKIEVKVEAKVITVKSDGSFWAETVMFDMIGQVVDKLNLLCGSFLAVDVENRRYGWLRQKNYLNEEKSV